MASVASPWYFPGVLTADQIDVDFNFFNDTPPGKDPDAFSPTLRRYHQMLWSKPLPSGEDFVLERPAASLSPYLILNSGGKRIVLGSDTIATRHAKKLRHLYEQIPEDENEAFLARSYTICGFIVFPVHPHSMNQRRGTHPQISDRWDLTLEAIRRFYQGGVSPLTEVLEQDAAFFTMFGSFEGYVRHFLLDDFLNTDGSVRMLLPFDDFETPALPDSLESYVRYRAENLALLEARRARIAASLS